MTHYSEHTIFGPLDTLDANHAGWKEIQQTGHATLKENRIVRALRFLHPTAEKVRDRLAEYDLASQLQIAASIANTVGFAKNTLEAEAESHRRGGIQALDLSDYMPTGLHYGVKQRGRASLANEESVRANARKIMQMRETLPIKQPDMLRIDTPKMPLFWGAAELYGMARAGFDPGALRDYLSFSDVTQLNHRTHGFLQHSGSVVERLSGEEQSVTDVLAQDLSVNLTEAMIIADNPTPRVMYGAALRMIDAQK